MSIYVRYSPAGRDESSVGDSATLKEAGAVWAGDVNSVEYSMDNDPDASAADSHVSRGANSSDPPNEAVSESSWVVNTEDPSWDNWITGESSLSMDVAVGRDDDASIYSDEASSGSVRDSARDDHVVMLVDTSLLVDDIPDSGDTSRALGSMRSEESRNMGKIIGDAMGSSSSVRRSSEDRVRSDDAVPADYDASVDRNWAGVEDNSSARISPRGANCNRGARSGGRPSDDTYWSIGTARVADTDRTVADEPTEVHSIAKPRDNGNRAWALSSEESTGSDSRVRSEAECCINSESDVSKSAIARTMDNERLISAKDDPAVSPADNGVHTAPAGDDIPAARDNSTGND